MNLALVNVAEAPVVEALAGEVSEASGRIGVMAFGTGEAGVKQADVHGTRYRRCEFRQQALGRLRLGKADAVHDDILALDADRLGATSEDIWFPQS
jgi:hypothetical protein